MPAEETVLDPPVTPAPVFALRAIRGVFWGSPESSPDRDNKENISPVKTNLKSLDINNGQQTPRLSPQKRKRDSNPQSSPTKSILRAPGAAPTPRAKSLRDVNVKFKSLSPDVRRKVDLQSVVDSTKAKETRFATLTNSISKAGADKTVLDVVSNDTNQRTNAKLDGDQLAKLPEADLDAYVRRTEKEMKRLIRYGQKWRDYARRQDEENAKLRLLLEQVQSDNQRLEAALEKSSGRQGSSREGRRKASQLPARVARAVPGSSTADAATLPGNPASTNLLPTAAAQEIEDLLDLTPPPSSTTLPPTHPSASAPTASQTQPQTQTLAQPRPSHQNALPLHPAPSHRPQPHRRQRPASAHHSPLTTLQHRIEGSVLPVADTAARTRLRPERIAEIRRRLIVKDQARKAGVGLLAMPLSEGERGEDGFGGRVGESEREKLLQDGKEESGVDWVGI